MEKHFVTFYSPGTFVAETSSKPIGASWDIETAVSMARDIVERHGAKPYGFRFTTRRRDEDDLDSSVTATSPMYYLGGKVETLDQVAARNDPKDEILLSNMRCNNYNRIIVNNNSYRWTQPLKIDDVVLDVTL